MSSRTKNLLWTVVVLIAFFMITSVRGLNEITIDFGDNVLSLSGPKQFSYLIEYDKIDSLSMVESFDPGTPVSGDENRRLMWGTYKNDRWGEYTLCVSKKIDCAILITMETGSLIVFNIESNDTTTALLDMFNDLLTARNTALTG